MTDYSIVKEYEKLQSKAENLDMKLKIANGGKFKISKGDKGWSFLSLNDAGCFLLGASVR